MQKATLRKTEKNRKHVNMCWAPWTFTEHLILPKDLQKAFILPKRLRNTLLLPEHLQHTLILSKCLQNTLCICRTHLDLTWALAEHLDLIWICAEHPDLTWAFAEHNDLTWAFTEHLDLKPVLNWANVCSLNILRTLQRTMIRFLIELLVCQTWFRQSKVYFILNWLVMRCKLRPELEADAQQTAWSKM